MNLEEWREVQATEPATPKQVGAIRGQFMRLGFGEADRAGRLAICAALAGLDQLRSTCDLTIGQAGQLYRRLDGIGSRGELLAAAGLDEHDQGQAAEPGAGRERGRSAGPTLAEAVSQLAFAFLAWRERLGHSAAVEPEARQSGD